MERDIFRFFSKAMHKNISVCVLKPKKITHVLFLLHGYDGSSGEIYDKCQDILVKIVDQKNTMIVLPNVDNDFYISRMDKNYDTFLTQELVEKLNIEKLPMSIAGISMGGYGACLIGARHPYLYKNIFSIMGAFIQDDVRIGNPEIVSTGLMTFAYFKDTFGPITSLDSSYKTNVVNALSLLRHVRRIPNLMLYCGKNDFLFERNQKVCSKLESYNIPYSFIPIENVAHDYDCVNTALCCIQEIL